jgi:hypothetical protein
MPYIQKNSRRWFDEALEELRQGLGPVGELNYCVTKLCIGWVKEHGGMSYDNLNAAIGALESAKLELYRRVVAPYENSKLAEHGDVY